MRLASLETDMMLTSLKQQAMPMLPTKIAQTNGPLIRFVGEPLTERTFETRSDNPILVTLRVWQTQAGNLIGQTIREPVDHEGDREAERTVEAVIVESRGQETMAMRLALMDFFDWDPEALQMVSYDLGWTCVREVP